MGIIKAFSQSSYRSVWTNEATEVSGGQCGSTLYLEIKLQLRPAEKERIHYFAQKYTYSELK